jgi:hypothetical protein
LAWGREVNEEDKEAKGRRSVFFSSHLDNYHYLAQESMLSVSVQYV